MTENDNIFLNGENCNGCVPKRLCPNLCLQIRDFSN